jgi:hypothetical protein
MRIVVDRPADHQVWERSVLLAGWIEGVEDAGRMHASAGDVELTVRSCLHPRGLGRPDLHGFWTELILQRHLDGVRQGLLPVEVFRDERPVARVRLRISPVAIELARRYPLDLDEYPVPLPVGAETREAAPVTLVFPGLGAVGGSSLNHLLRRKMLREGWTTPVYDEANTPFLWAQIQTQRPRPVYRWLDGHGCYGAADACDGRTARVTLLREPIRRLVSAFSYGVLVHPDLFAAGSFDEFVESGAARHHSQAVGLLRAAGCSVEIPRSNAELLSAARAELTRGYALVGITECFEETLFLLCRLAGYDSIGMWWRVLAAPRLVEPDHLDPRTRTRLEHDLAPDLALYEEAHAAFTARVARASFGPALQQYRDAAARCVELSPVAKAVECLRWRQVIADLSLRGGTA